MAEAGSGSIVNVVTPSRSTGAPDVRPLRGGAGRGGQHGQVPGAVPDAARRDHQRLRPRRLRHAGHGGAELETVGRTEESFTDELVAEGTTVRLGTVDEMAAMVLFLCSPAARYVMRVTIIADGASMQTNWPSLFPEDEM